MKQDSTRLIEEGLRDYHQESIPNNEFQEVDIQLRELVKNAHQFDMPNHEGNNYYIDCDDHGHIKTTQYSSLSQTNDGDWPFIVPGAFVEEVLNIVNDPNQRLNTIRAAIELWYSKVNKILHIQNKIIVSIRSKAKKIISWQLVYDKAAGEYSVKTWKIAELNGPDSNYRTQFGHYTQVGGLYNSEEELNQAIDNLRGEPVFAIFENRAAGEVFWSQEDNLSGNWQGSKYGHSNYVTNFKTQAEAEKYVKDRQDYYDQIEQRRLEA